jgi:diaminopimelate epimerase
MDSPEIPFAKMTGAGNDFVLIDNRAASQKRDWSTLAPALCDRRYGIGADGLLVLQASADGPDFGMEYYNADGSYGGMCGNGGRCAAWYVADATGQAEVSFVAVDHLYRAKRIGENMIRLRMKDISSVRMGEAISGGGRAFTAHYVDSGTAHVVLWYDDLPASLKTGFDSMDIEEMGKLIRYHEKYAPVGANVNIVRALDASTIAMRTYEKGVEGETLACGTGSVASAVVAHLAKNFPQDIRVITRSNEELRVSFESRNGTFVNVFLSGPAKIVFRGSVNLSDLSVRSTITIPS